MKVLTPGHKYELFGFDDLANTQTIQFIEKGKRKDAPFPRPIDSDPDEFITFNDGTTNEEVLEMLIDRTSYLNGLFPCKENACCITHLQEALMWLEKRTKDRVKRGVEGKLKA